MPNATPAQDLLNAFGEEGVCEAILGGESLTGLAARIGVGLTRLLVWCEVTPERSARVAEARRRSALAWDEKAAEAISQAGEKFDLDKARELAHHYRWRASKINRRDYGERTTNEHVGADGGAVKIETTDAETARRLAFLLTKGTK